jgi:hypothetical protein
MLKNHTADSVMESVTSTTSFAQRPHASNRIGQRGERHQNILETTPCRCI